MEDFKLTPRAFITSLFGSSSKLLKQSLSFEMSSSGLLNNNASWILAAMDFYIYSSSSYENAKYNS